MAKLPGAKMSPRIVNGVLLWYEGDTFALNLHLSIKDQDGTPVTLSSTDTLELTFYSRNAAVVETMTFTGEVLSGGTVKVTVDEDTSALFPVGHYSYDLRLLGAERKTLVRGGKITVE